MPGMRTRGHLSATDQEPDDKQGAHARVVKLGQKRAAASKQIRPLTGAETLGNARP